MLFLLPLSAFHHKWSSASSRCTAIVRRVSLTVTPLISLVLLNTTSKTHTHTHTLWHTLFHSHTLSLSLPSYSFFCRDKNAKGNKVLRRRWKKSKKISLITSYLFLWKAENLAWSHFFSYNFSTSIISPLFSPWILLTLSRVITLLFSLELNWKKNV